MNKAYVLGALHDGVFRRKTCRIVQKEYEYIKLLQDGIQSLGQKAWIYQEGSSRNLFVVEFSRSFLSGFEVSTQQEKTDYIRGYFDADGGISRNPDVRYYLYFAQKDLADLKQVRKYLMELSMKCGVIHNPSRSTDPNYWRFYVKAESYEHFAQVVGSWHPVKRQFLRMKI
ncbi:hypothetical protein A3B02_00945 [Candidatus Roizmanbacteria bacterium RIFCSPLOWO2_01_FULL_42_14]|uniref:DOD-type homing endonuclease domain-containing protein n=3 Tax=Candidatus Roizmaniibacteriota TaxID=1752723 RepID=A0A1F7JTD4_9BACT|nr:MAG: hypothetical protein A3D08_02190 [Candidatus Roizmanbacteria bacterium RIFCSPHIGHO2_02_FULL_43_11]OGK51404.1 MAG: hypothetical protein A3B02_00945 [Candidatus Roizmanbacteria bacterium RIFCSPLOWO2_01_FULL_42_14]OGK58875.1 MAG: hypothetical protein A3I56_04445 [Candidatus Roizmanbacteria bacterium RIFCSPLOWO2_02_FULL_43_10]